MSLAYGFNVKKAEELVGNMATAYSDFGSKIKTEWEAVVNTLQTEWIGPDEQDFEKKFAERVCKMYAQAYTLVDTSIKNVISLTNSWIEFQNKNTLSGEAIGTAKKMSTDVSLSKNEKIISHKPKTFSQTDDMGLANKNSDNKISNEVKDFVKNLKKQSKDLFDSIETSSAFFGDQSKKLKNYVEAVGDTLGEITVAVKDLDNALEKLAKSNYSTSDSNIEESLKTAESDVESIADELGDTRWK